MWSKFIIIKIVQMRDRFVLYQIVGRFFGFGKKLWLYIVNVYTVQFYNNSVHSVSDDLKTRV